MKFASLAAALGLATSATAAVASTASAASAASANSAATAMPPGYTKCASQAFANALVNDFIAANFRNQSTSFGSPYNTLEAILANNYEEISDSILSLEGRPLGTVPSASGKQQIIEGSIQNPPVSVTTYDILVANCNKVIWYWKIAGLGSGQDEVKGINIMTLAPNGQIESQVIEFNSIAWGTDTHQLPPQCYGESGSNGTSGGGPPGAATTTSHLTPVKLQASTAPAANAAANSAAAR